MKTNGHEIVKVGMQVKYRGDFGSGPVKTATIEGIEYCGAEHEKYGEPVDQVASRWLHFCCIDLNDGHWAYGYQVVEILG